MEHFRQLLSLILISGVLLTFCERHFVSIAQAAGNFAGRRAIFDEHIDWTTKEAADRTLKRIKDAGFNVYIPNVWHGRGATWPSKYAPWDILMENQPKTNYDPLQYLIRKAHEMGIEVHPWFNCALRQSDLFPEFAEPGTPEGAFDVHNERFHLLLADLIGEVVDRYDVDGINLDIVRTVGLCLSESCKKEYKQKYGRDLSLDTITFKLTFGRVPTLVEYQETAVTAMVRTITDRVRQTNPQILISADVIPDVASLEQGQNGIDWANKGLVDVLFRMDYYRNIDTKLTDSIRSRLKNPEALTLLISDVSNAEEIAPRQKHFSRDGKWLAETVSMIQARWPRTGIGIYLYKWLSDEQIGALRSGPFRIQPPIGLRTE